MPRYKITVDFDGDVTEYETEAENLELAEQEASDKLRDMIYDRTAYGAEEIE